MQPGYLKEDNGFVLIWYYAGEIKADKVENITSAEKIEKMTNMRLIDFSVGIPENISLDFSIYVSGKQVFSQGVLQNIILNPESSRPISTIERIFTRAVSFSNSRSNLYFKPAKDTLREIFLYDYYTVYDHEAPMKTVVKHDYKILRQDENVEKNWKIELVKYRMMSSL